MHNSLLTYSFVIFISFASALNIAYAEPTYNNGAHGYSSLHDLKYPKNFRHFDYVNPNAPKGGKIRIGRRGTFNSLNFLKYPGRTPIGRNELPFNLTSYLYDSLLVPSSDEVAGYYNLLASHVDVAENFKWVKFKLRDDAFWHDGKAITADDVVFTFETIKKQGFPFYRQTLRHISIKQDGPMSVTFTANKPGNRDLARLVGTMPIHPKHYWQKNDVSKTTLVFPLTSGPYKIVRVDAGRFLRLERVSNYWAQNHPVNIGQYNFNQIELIFYKDNVSAIEAFKAGQYDIRLENDATFWSQAYQGVQSEADEIKQLELQLDSPGDTVRLIFNFRRPIFKNRRVRKALALMYNFDQVNRLLFHSKYEAVESSYGKTELAAKGAADSLEQKLLLPFIKDLPIGILKRAAPAWRSKTLAHREALRKASNLLNAAGIKLKDGVRIDPNTGNPLNLSVAYSNPRHQRVLSVYANQLRRLGITLSYPALEPVSASQKILSHDYDLVILNSKPSMVTGPREELLWSSRFVDIKKSYAFAGVQDRAFDHLIPAMKNARDLKKMQAATRAFDRVLRWQIYDIPLWGKSKTWVAVWNKFGWPDTPPKYGLSIIDRWWSSDEKVRHSKILPN